MKDKHKEKLRLARKNMSVREIKEKTSPFDSKWWESRKEAIDIRVKKTEANQKEASRLRREKLKNEKESK